MKDYAKMPKAPSAPKTKSAKPGDVPVATKNKGKSRDIRNKVK
jgi:hypothetical protein